MQNASSTDSFHGKVMWNRYICRNSFVVAAFLMNQQHRTINGIQVKRACFNQCCEYACKYTKLTIGSVLHMLIFVAGVVVA